MASRVFPCPKCSQLNTDRRVTCKRCGVNLQEAQFELEQKAFDTVVELSLAERSDILSRKIANYMTDGYRVVSRADTSAQLLKPKEFSLLAALAWFCLFGVGVLLYFFYYLSKHDEAIYLIVAPGGQILVK